MSSVRWLLPLLALALTGCEATPLDPLGGGGDPQFGTVKARINDVSFEATFATTQTWDNARQINGLTQRNSTSGPHLLLVMNPFQGTGTYVLGEADHQIFGNNIPGTSALGMFNTAAMGGTGVIQVTEFSASRIRGTFHFTIPAGPLNNHISGTQGEFDVPR